MNATKCHLCGRFLSTSEAKFHFVPLNEFGPEEAWWECRKRCERKIEKEPA